MKECKKCRHCYEDDSTSCPIDDHALVSPFAGTAVLDAKYLLERRLGSGGMGAVYLAKHTVLQKAFAVKLVKPRESRDIRFLARFRIEAEALGKLNHPYIVQVTDYGIDPRNNGIPYLVMEYLEGKSLAEKMYSKGALQFEEALPLLSSIAQALDYAHSCGILHRDLKPENVFLAQSTTGGNEIVKIFDFGLARFLDERASEHIQSSAKYDATEQLHPDEHNTQCMGSEEQTQVQIVSAITDGETVEVTHLSEAKTGSATTDGEQPTGRLTMPGTFMGTPLYMAPEIIQMQDATQASDIYAFGIVIFEMLTGHPPFSGSSEQIMNLHLKEKPPPPTFLNTDLPDELDTAILLPLEKNPSSRPSSAQAVVTQLKEAYHHSQIRLWKEKEFPRRIRISLLAALLAVIVFWIIAIVPYFQLLEEKLIDARFYFASVHAPESHIILISLDDATLSADPTPLVNKADEIGSTLQDVFNAGARGVAIDLLMPASWNRSPAFQKLVLQHSNRIVLAALSTPDSKVVGPESLDTLTAVALGTERISNLFGFVNMKEDSDGIIRTMVLAYKDQDGKTRNSFAHQFAQLITDTPVAPVNQKHLWIDYSINWLQIQKLSWKDMSAMVKQKPDVFRNKYVLVGGEFPASGDEYYRIPHPRSLPGKTSGLVLQAIAVNTLLQNMHIQSVSKIWASFIIFIFFAAAAFVLLYSKKVIANVVWLSVLCVLYIIASFLVFHFSRWLFPISAPFIVCVIVVGAVLWIRTKLPVYATPL